MNIMIPYAQGFKYDFSGKNLAPLIIFFVFRLEIFK